MSHLIGHLTLFWLWSLDNATPDGLLGHVSSSTIAIASDWHYDPVSFVKALVSCAWLAETPDGLVIHDWREYGGKYQEKLVIDRERKRVQRMSIGSPSDGVGIPEMSQVEKRRGEENITTTSPPTPATQKNDPYPTWLTELHTIQAWPKSDTVDAKLLAHVALKGYSPATCEYVANSLIAKWPPSKTSKDPVATYRNWLVLQVRRDAAEPPALFRPGPSSANGQAPPDKYAAERERIAKLGIAEGKDVS